MSLLDQLISYWKLDEASGNAIDAHGSNDLTETGGTIGSAAGKVGNARDFEAGDTECFEIADNADLSTGDIDFTVAAWVNAETLTNFPVIAHKGWAGAASANREWVLYYNTLTNKFTLEVGSLLGGGANVVVAADTPSPASTGTWYFVVGWHDAVNNQIGISVNAASPTTAAHSGGVNDGTSAFVVGASASQNLYWDGLIDEVSFWKRVLTSTERTDLYNSGNGLSYDDFADAAIEANITATAEEATADLASSVAHQVTASAQAPAAEADITAAVGITADVAASAPEATTDASATSTHPASIGAAAEAGVADITASSTISADITASATEATADAAATSTHPATITASATEAQADITAETGGIATIAAAAPEAVADGTVMVTHPASIGAQAEAGQADLAASVEAKFASIAAAPPEGEAAGSVVMSHPVSIAAAGEEGQADVAAVSSHTLTVAGSADEAQADAAVTVAHPAAIDAVAAEGAASISTDSTITGSMDAAALEATAAITATRTDESGLVRQAVLDGYPCAIGHIGTPGSDQLIDPGALMTALIDGRTFAEALALATPTINSSWRAIFDPLAICPMPRQGFNVTRQDTGDLIAVVPAGVTDLDLDGLLGDGEYTLALTRVDEFGNESEAEEIRVDVVAGVPAGAMAPPEEIECEVEAAGMVRVTWLVRNTDRSQDWADEYEIADGSDLATILATVTGSAGPRRYAAEVGPFAHEQTVRLVVRAKSAAGVGPWVPGAVVVADAEGPAAVQML